MPDNIRIAIDAMGGDHGPAVVLPGCDIALERHPDIQFLLFGDRAAIDPVLETLPRLKAKAAFTHTEVSIRMDDKPSQALRYGRGKSSMWLAVDAKIRALTHDQKSLDTFAKDFFGVDNGSFVTKTYTFDDVVNALNGVVKYDWAGFLERYVDELEPPFTKGLEATGWKLVYTDKESPYEKQYESQPESPRHIYNFTYSIGLTLTKDGGINDVRWNGPAFKAGIGSGGEVVAVNGQVVIRPMMYLALSYDHRVVDGQGAVTFLVHVKEALEDPQRLLLDI